VIACVTGRLATAEYAFFVHIISVDTCTWICPIV
jgi:hypothetical protein